MGGLLGKNVGLGVVVCFSGKDAGGKRRCATGSRWERGPRDCATENAEAGGRRKIRGLGTTGQSWALG